MFFNRRKNAVTRWKVVDNMFLSLLITGAIIEFSQVGAAFIDGIVISRFLGPEAMAANGIAHPIYSIVGVISGLIATGMQVTCSQLMGRGNTKDLNRYFSQSVYLGTALSVLGAILLIIFAAPFAVILGASGNAAELVTPAADYLRGFGFGIPPFVLVAIIAPAFQLDSGRKVIQTGAIIASVTDIVFDIAAVYCGLGIFGVGLATALSNYFNLIYLVIQFFRKKDRMLRFVKPDVPLGDYVKMLSNGTEKATRRLTNVIRPVILNTVIISYGGSVAMTALSIRNNFCNFTEIAASGIAAAVSLLCGLYYGEVNGEAIGEVKSCEWKSTALSSTVICAALIVLSKPIVNLYTSDETILPMAVFAIIMLGLQNALQTLLKSRISYLQAISKPLNLNLLVFSSQLVFVVLSAIVLGNIFGTYGILASFFVSDALSLAAVYIYYQIKTHRLVPGKDALLNLPPEFSLSPGDVISVDVRDQDDVTTTSEQIQMFCRGHKYDSKTSYYASLAFEEIAANIIQYGFPKNKKKDPIIDLRVVALKDSLVIRIRDDCPHFDITKRIAEINENDDDPASGLGIRITSKIAKNIEYTHAFETNNIIITYDV